jgi:hypothetical protein
VKLSLIADQAIGESGSRSDDGLGFEVYARVLAATAAETRGPFTIGVFGEWGTGKTSLLRLVEKKLVANPKIVTVWFNAWRYEREEHPIIPLLGTIIREIEEQKSVMRRLGESGKALIRALRAVAYGFSAKTTVKVPGFAEVEASFIAKDMIDRNQRLATDPLLDRSLYFGAFNSLDDIRLREDIRVVVFVDDLDRCFPDQAIRLLESIKLVLAQPGFIFVLGVARQVIEGYLNHRYTAEFGIKDFKGAQYLDKIVQLPFHIPPSASRTASLCQSLLAGQQSAVVEALQPILPVIASALGGNPRALVRFINNILIDTAISSEFSNEEGTIGIPLEYFAISRCLEHRWPDLFAMLTANDDLAATVADWRPSTYSSLAQDEGIEGSVASALVSEPDLARLLADPAGRAWLSNATLRQASVSFLLTQKRFSPLDSPEVSIQYDAFFSYSRADRRDVITIVEFLTRAGLKVFFDRDLSPGSRWADELQKALATSSTLCYCLGPDSSESRAQTDELLQAMANNRNQRIIPIILPGWDRDTARLPAQLRAIQALDFSSGITPSGLAELSQVLAHTRSSTGH